MVKPLTRDQKGTRYAMAGENWKFFDSVSFTDWCLMMDETWANHFPKKQISSQSNGNIQHLDSDCHISYKLFVLQSVYYPSNWQAVTVHTEATERELLTA